MSTLAFESPTAFRPEPPRDGRGNYLIQTDPTRKAKGYQRVTTMVKPLDDTYNLQKWQQRMVATGLVMQPTLLSSVGAHLHDKRKLNALCEDALAAAGANDRRERGTALHAYAQQLDAEVTPPHLSHEDRADLTAYMEWRVEHNVNVIASELVIVHDDLSVAGTFDRIYEIGGKRYIGDLKTGSSVDLSLPGYTAAMATYARGKLYDYPEGCTCSQFDKSSKPCAVFHPRRDLDGLETDRGLIVWVPAGEGRCEHRWVDLNVGWLGAQAAMAVHAFRKLEVAL